VTAGHGRRLRLALVAGIAWGVGLAAGVLAAAPAAGPVTPPPDFTLPKAESSPAPVPFSHAKHLPKVEKCTRCHMRGFKLKLGQSGPITLEALQQGKFCGMCHDGKTTFAGAAVFPIDACDKCHPS